MLSGFASVFIFLLVALAFTIVVLAFSALVRAKSPDAPGKRMPYECGEIPKGSAWVQFNIRFYVVALIFIIFDVEVIFLLPWAVVFRKLGAFAFLEGVVFVAILLVGLAYVWKKGDLEWVRPDDADAMRQ